MSAAAAISAASLAVLAGCAWLPVSLVSAPLPPPAATPASVAATGFGGRPMTSNSPTPHPLVTAAAGSKMRGAGDPFRRASVPVSASPASHRASPRTAASPVASHVTRAIPQPVKSASLAPSPTLGYGCAAAIDYLHAHANPAFTIICPGYAYGHQAMTCRGMPGYCPGRAVIVINDPCPAAYHNEAVNSWAGAQLDPYGSCPP